MTALYDPPAPELDEVGSPTLRARVLAHFDPTPAQWSDWKWQFRHRITTAAQLARIVPLAVVEQQHLDLVSQRYPFSITPYYLSLAREADRDDPILKQAIPSIEEWLHLDVGDDDPLEEHADSPVPGLVHRYPDRALLVVTDICPLLCRHCTRKREWAAGNWVRPQADLDRAIAYIRETPAIRDVIISGGDPLSLDNARLERILADLRSIPTVEIIRFGSRYPVVLPQRIDEEFCRICDAYGPVWLNTHFNHPNEVTPEAARAVRELLRAGVPVNNQTVLLRGVNDTVETQKALSHALLKIRVRPYYLYHADEVRGTEHLRTNVETGVKIIEGLRGHTSGLGVPTFVVGVPGGGGKIPVQPDYVLSMDSEELVLRNYENLVFRYRNPASDGPGDVAPPTVAATARPEPATGAEPSPRLARRRRRAP
ncbi:MAG: lysine 2,3-aminomutase [Chloroflexota bacterium]|jgi:lysine 2,3-aminomutase|nr:lysine 2,3-aminomutase [Chloroflexota bacterium]